ncbi:unnamed protein product, partial [Ectocarpus sp. 12 AP-2014]
RSFSRRVSRKLSCRWEYFGMPALFILLREMFCHVVPCSSIIPTFVKLSMCRYQGFLFLLMDAALASGSMSFHNRTRHSTTIHDRSDLFLRRAIAAGQVHVAVNVQ